MTEKIKNIIPITFAGGSGGAFLSVFLNKALNNNHNPIIVSEHGNAHYSKFCNFADPKSRGDNPKSIVRAMINNYRNSEAIYVASHFEDLEILNQFNNIIKIIIERDDAEELALSFVGKYIIDIQNTDSDSHKDYYKMFLGTFRLSNHYQWYLTKSPESFIHNVTWKQLLHSPPSELIQLLSNYTDIPSTNFDETALLQWRNATINGFQKLRIKFSENQ